MTNICLVLLLLLLLPLFLFILVEHDFECTIRTVTIDDRVRGWG